MFDAGMKLIPLDVVIKSTAELGYPPSAELARGVGTVALICTALYAFPRTAVLGEILLTAYMGGHGRYSPPGWQSALHPYVVRRLSGHPCMGRPLYARRPDQGVAAGENAFFGRMK